MDHNDEQPDTFTETTEAILTFGPRLPGEGGAVACMDTISDLVPLYRHALSPAQPPLETVREVLAAPWQRLPHEVIDRLALFGTMAVSEGEMPDIPPGSDEVGRGRQRGHDGLEGLGRPTPGIVPRIRLARVRARPDPRSIPAALSLW
jgi:hypothetical protein